MKTVCPECGVLIEYMEGDPPFCCEECGAYLHLKQMVFEFGHLEEAPSQFTGKGFKEK